MNFDELQLPISDSISSYPEETKLSIYQYLSQMDEIHKKAYLIAFQHLGTSFHITRSIGYIEWKKTQK